MKTKTIAVTMLAVLLVGAAASQTAQTRPTTNLEPTLLNTDPAPVQSGDDADIRFKISNNGNTEAEDVEVELLDTYPFDLKPDRKRNYSLGTVSPGEEYHISTEVLVADDAPDGPNDFRVRVSYGDFSTTKNIPVEVQSQDIELNLANLQTEPSQLRPDTEDNTVNIDVVNNGEKTAENVVLNLDLPGFFQQTSSFSTRQALGNIPAGETQTASFNFDINETAPEGAITVNGELSYSPNDSNSEVTEEANFDVYMEGRPQFQIENVESDLRTGSTGEVRLEVRNTGESTSSSTRIRVMDSSEQPFSYSSASQYIGTLEPDQTGTAVFEVDTDQDATVKDYMIDFEARGVKGTEVFVEDETVDVGVSNGQNSETPLAPIAGGILVVLGGLAYYFRDRIREIVQ